MAIHLGGGGGGGCCGSVGWEKGSGAPGLRANGVNVERGQRGLGEGVHRRRGGSKHRLWRVGRIPQATARARGERGAGLERVWKGARRGSISS
jgi:hypothetical protein